MTQEAKCPGCSTKVEFTDWDVADEALATNCLFYCEKEENRWIDNPLCYEARNVRSNVDDRPVTVTKKKKSKFKGKKKVRR